MGNSDTPKRQHLAAYEVLPAMQHETDFFLSRSPSQIIVLALAGGAFVTMGALFSLLLSTGVTSYGPQLLLQGLGFSAGFFMIILSRSALFTEANVILPASYLHSTPRFLPLAAFRFWGLAWVGNMLGAFLIGLVVAFAQEYPDQVYIGLDHVVAKKMAYMDKGGTTAWLQVVVSGMLGNGMIGMAAFFATMAKTLIGKYVPIFLIVTLFVAANLQHSPANMGFFSLSMAFGGGPGWWDAFVWNIIPAGVGNLLGGFLLVSLPFWYGLKPE